MLERDFIVLLNLIASIIYLVFGLFVFQKNKKSATNIFFGYACLTLFFWAIGTTLYQCALENSSLFWARLDYAFATFMGTSLLSFALIFPSEKFTPHFKKLILLFLPNFFIFFIALWPRGVIENVIFHYDRQKEIIFNPFWFKFYMVYYFIYFGAGLFIFLKKYFIARGLLRRQFLYIILAFFTVIVLGLVFNLVLIMPGINIFTYDWLGPLTALFLPIVIILAIFKHHLMNIRALGTEIFAGCISLVFLIQLILAKSLLEFLLRFFLLFLVALFSLFLVRGAFREMNELKKLDQMKSEFVSIASHQLRAPLTAIKGYLSLLLEDSYGKLEARTKEVLKNIYISNERLIRLVNELLNVSLMDFGKLEFDFKRFSFENLVSAVIDEMRIEAYQKNINLCWEKPSQPLPEIMGDPEKLYHVVLNIIDNAIKYTKEGSISVNIKGAGEEKTKKILLTVSDTGEGIENDRLKTVFEGFNRGARASKMHTEGAGLGLSFAAKIVRAHQGKIWVESEGEGKGSTFYVELPII